VSVEAKADAGACASGAALALFGRGAAYPELLETGHFVFGVVADLFDFARVGDEAKAVDGD